MYDLAKIITLFKNGAIIAYPTEGVFGLGCDPLNESAVNKLLTLKQRPIEKGLIVIAAHWQQLADWMAPLSLEQQARIDAEYDHPITWLVPASEKVPAWIRGQYTKVALRVTQHPVAREICLAFGGPIVSTSANISNQAPCLNYQAAYEQFAEEIAYIIDAPTLGLDKPSEIRDVVSGEVLRV